MLDAIVATNKLNTTGQAYGVWLHDLLRHAASGAGQGHGAGQFVLGHNALNGNARPRSNGEKEPVALFMDLSRSNEDSLGDVV